MHSKIRTSLFALAMLSPVLANAADSANAKPGGELNLMLITMVSLAIVLLAIIGLAGLTLRNLSIVWREKNDKEKQSSGGVVKSLLLLLTLGFAGFTAKAAEETAEVATGNWDKQVISGMPAFDFYFITGIIALEFLVIICLLIYIRIFIKILADKPETAEAAKKVVKVSFWDKFNKVVPIEKEKDIMLDHNYDGIRELDNSLPPWWKYGFYLTIVVGIIYLWRFHVSGTGPSSEQEYIAEVQKAEEEIASYLAQSANNVDENTVTLITDASALASGQKIFQSACAACHAADGGGGVGPNLTDEYWLHGGSVKDVFKSIKYGWQDKGMKSWKDDYSPRQIAEITSYVISLKGTKPAAPKEPQGQIFEEEGTTPSADSTKTVAAK